MSLLESCEDSSVGAVGVDVPVCVPTIRSFKDIEDCLVGADGRGTVGRVHSSTVNGSASDLS